MFPYSAARRTMLEAAARHNAESCNPGYNLCEVYAGYFARRFGVILFASFAAGFPMHA
jgi:hypothetical protein